MSGLVARATGGRSPSPGPAAYTVASTLGDAPKYTLKSRHDMNTKANDAPYRDLPTTVGDAPKYSLASRHKVKDAESTPGPNYVPPPLGADAQKASMSSRHGDARDPRADNPGPGAYNIQPKFANDAQKSTLHGRTGSDKDGTDSPGPAAYNPNMDAVRAKAPAASMHIRPQDRNAEVTPGPGDYAISRDLGGKGASMHIKGRDAQPEMTPGPGAYSPTDKTLGDAPKFTMKGRHEQNQNVNNAPYRALPSTVGEGPKISMSSRHKVKDAENTPGPNYVPPPLGADAPRTTFRLLLVRMRRKRPCRRGTVMFVILVLTTQAPVLTTSSLSLPMMHKNRLCTGGLEVTTVRQTPQALLRTTRTWTLFARRLRRPPCTSGLKTEAPMLHQAQVIMRSLAILAVRAQVCISRGVTRSRR